MFRIIIPIEDLVQELSFYYSLSTISHIVPQELQYSNQQNGLFKWYIEGKIEARELLPSIRSFYEDVLTDVDKVLEKRRELPPREFKMMYSALKIIAATDEQLIKALDESKPQLISQLNN